MIDFIILVFIIFLAYFAVGTMPALKGRYPFPFILMFFSFVTVLPVIVGVVLGAAFFYWLPIFIFKMTLFLLSIAIVIYFYRMYHPSYGYIPYYGRIHLVILFLFFFLLGLEFTTYGFSAWFLFLIIPIGLFGLIGGFMIMVSSQVYFRYLTFIHFVPLILFLFVAILKLI